MRKIIGIIQARLGSTRLQGKVLLDLEGKPVLGHVIERVKKCRQVEEVLVATTLASADAKIAELCLKIGVPVYRGSQDDVLDRYYQAAKLYQARQVVRITADCPLIDPEVIDWVINVHLSQGNDYTSNAVTDTFPDGEDVEVFSFHALEKCWHEANLASEREHLNPYIRKNRAKFKVGVLECGQDYSRKRWTLDEPQDYEFIKLVYKNLYPGNPVFGMKEILAFLELHPEAEKVNSGIIRNEGYLKSLKKDKVMEKRCSR
jgi:spore coat polysaccharide biosynthesis protein SpsF (cytidylyltransferase family)